MTNKEHRSPRPDTPLRDEIYGLFSEANLTGGPDTAFSTEYLLHLLRTRFESLREHPRYYHYVCWGSGTVMVRDKWGHEPTLKCRSYNGDFNCGCRACPWPDGVITGILLLTDDQVHYNTMLDRVLALLAPATEDTV